MSTLTQKRCLVTSAVVHGLLLGAWSVLSAFSPKAPTLPAVHYVAVTLAPAVAAERIPGGNPGSEKPTRDVTVPSPSTDAPPPPPTRRSPPVTPPKLPPAAPTPAPEKPTIPPPHIVRKPLPNTSDAMVATTKPTIKTTPNVVPTKNAEDRKRREREEKEAREEEAREDERQAKADAQRRAEFSRRDQERRDNLKNTLAGLEKSFAPTTKVEIPGAGGSSAVTISYGDMVQAIFQAAWNRNRPATLATKFARSRVLLTIRRDGSFTYRVLTPSKIADVDAAISRILSQQRRLDPFPPDLKRDEVEIIVNFNLESSAPG